MKLLNDIFYFVEGKKLEGLYPQAVNAKGPLPWHNHLPTCS